MSEVLPLPVAPITVMRWPAGTPKLTSWSTGTAPRLCGTRRETPINSSMSEH